MSKRKILSLALTLCMVAILAVGGTLAYFTDTDSQLNVMILGNVNISQNETDKNGNDFVQDQALLPMVDAREEGEAVVVNGYFSENMKNVVDKVVTVKNDAAADAKNQDAYVRTIIAFETARHYAEGSSTEFTDMHDVYIGVTGDFEYIDRYVTVNGVEYTLAVKVYEDALAPQATTEPSLKQVFMAPTAGNEISDIFGSEYTIIALSQGTQTTGFASAEEALNEAFGDLEDETDVTDEELIAWLAAAQKA